MAPRVAGLATRPAGLRPAVTAAPGPSPRARRYAAGLLVAAAVLTACSPADSARDAVGRPACADPGGLALTNAAACREAIELANARLGWLHAPISSIDYRTSLCPPNARCAALLLANDAWVTFRFWAGDPVTVHVSRQDDGSLLAGEPETPPDVVLEPLTPYSAVSSGGRRLLNSRHSARS